MQRFIVRSAFGDYFTSKFDQLPRSLFDQASSYCTVGFKIASLGPEVLDVVFFVFRIVFFFDIIFVDLRDRLVGFHIIYNSSNVQVKI